MVGAMTASIAVVGGVPRAPGVREGGAGRRGRVRVGAGVRRCGREGVRTWATTKDLASTSTVPPLVRSGEGQESLQARFERMIRKAQDEICAGIAAADGQATFMEESWTREDGGGGVSRVLQDGAVFEKAGVNVSVVYGSMSREAVAAATGSEPNSTAPKGPPKADEPKVPFFAAGISSVMHPKNPHAPTMHFNYRYFETSDPTGQVAGHWFGGGQDLSPAYLYEDDVKHFHGSLKGVCDKHDPAFYPKFKAWADEYFYIAHREETRGVGGIFFDNLNDRDPDALFAFCEDLASTVCDAYVPIIEKRKGQAFTQAEQDWQRLRRGRYVEFNLVYDRGTTFGLKTGGRVESILMSMPLHTRWEYCQEPAPGSPEADLIDACRSPRTWC